MSIDLLVDQLCSKGYAVIDNFFPKTLYDALSERARIIHNEECYHEAKIGADSQTHSNKNIRTDSICWLSKDSENHAEQNYLEQMSKLAQEFNQTLFLGLNDFETHFALYHPGSFYKKHTDQFQNKKTRKISCVYYLNQEWEPSFGGLLKLYDLDEKIMEEILPLGNRFLCFKSELPHEVTASFHQRFSLAGWMLSRPHLIIY